MELAPERRAEAAGVLAAAFLDDPAWIGIGPRRRAHRNRVLRMYYGVALMGALRAGGPSWAAVRDGALLGVAVTFARGEDFPPAYGELLETVGMLLAGPAPLLRAAQVDEKMRRHRPQEPHLYLWFLAAHPSAQRQGVGRALLAHVLAEADARDRFAFLETTRPENVPYYAGFGFREVDQEGLPGDARMWFMRRDRRGIPEPN